MRAWIGLCLGGLGLAGMLAHCKMDAPQDGWVSLRFGGSPCFRLEIARTARQQVQGLAGRADLAADAGMLFVYAEAAERSFWMLDTRIPLDILFIREDATIARVTHARPLDLTPLPSGAPVLWVAEINGGQAAAHDIREGDSVTPCF